MSGVMSHHQKDQQHFEVINIKQTIFCHNKNSIIKISVSIFIDTYFQVFTFDRYNDERESYNIIQNRIIIKNTCLLL